MSDTELIGKLRKQAKCVYLATDKEVADDLSAGLTAAADRIAELEAEIREWESMCLDSEGFPRGGDYILKWMRSWRERHDALKGDAK